LITLAITPLFCGVIAYDNQPSFRLFPVTSSSLDLPPKGVPLIEGKSLAKIKQIMQEIMYEKETIYRRADPRDT